MMSADEFFKAKKKVGKVICNSSNDITSENFDSKKVHQDKGFTINYISS